MHGSSACGRQAFPLPLRDALLEDHDQKQEAATEYELPPRGNGSLKIQKVVHHSQQKDTGKRWKHAPLPPSEKRSSHDGRGYGIRLPAQSGHRLTRP